MRLLSVLSAPKTTPAPLPPRMAGRGRDCRGIRADESLASRHGRGESYR